jgi:hypothetical protein
MKTKNSDQIAAEQKMRNWNDLTEIERLRESNRILLKRLRELETPRKETAERIMTYQDELRVRREELRELREEVRRLQALLRKAGLT